MYAHEYLIMVAEDICNKSIGRRAVEDTMRVLNETFGGRFIQVSELPEHWETVYANFVIVQSTPSGKTFEIWMNHPETAAKLAAMGYQLS